jgi:hypothetical protein
VADDELKLRHTAYVVKPQPGLLRLLRLQIPDRCVTLVARGSVYGGVIATLGRLFAECLGLWVFCLTFNISFITRTFAAT